MHVSNQASSDKTWRLFLASFSLFVMAALFLYHGLIAEFSLSENANPVDRLKSVLFSPDPLMLIGGLLLVSTASLTLWLGVKKRGDLAGSLVASDQRALLLLIIVTPLFAHALAAPGLLVTGDAGAHAARIAEFARVVSAGEVPFWSNLYFAGSSLLQFTGPIYHWLVGLVTLITEDAHLSIKIVTILLRIVIAMASYGLCRALGLPRWSSVFGALAVAGSFYLSYILSVRSSFPQVIVIACFAGLLALVEAQLHRSSLSLSWVLKVALLAIILIGTHQPTAVYAAILIGVYLMVRIIALKDFSRVRTTALACLLSVPIILLGSAFFIVPFLVEAGATGEPDVAQSILHVGWPRQSELSVVAHWRAYLLGPGYATYLGIPVLVAALLVPIFLWRTGSFPMKGAWVALTLTGLVTFFVDIDYVRDFGFLAVLLGAAAAIGFSGLVARAPSSVAPAFLVPAFLVVAMLVDWGLASVQPWVRPDLIALAEKGQKIAETHPNRRFVEIVDGEVHGGPGMSMLHLAPLQILHGPHKLDASPAHNAVLTVLIMVNENRFIDRDITDLDLEVRSALGLFNTGGLIETPPAKRKPSGAQITLHPLAASPVLFSRRLQEYPSPPWLGKPGYWIPRKQTDTHQKDKDYMRGLVRLMQPQVDAATADVFLVPKATNFLKDPDGLKITDFSSPPTSDAPRGSAIRLNQYQVESQSVKLEIDVVADGFLRLAHPVSKYLTLLVDGKNTAPIADVTGMVILPITAGTHRLELTWSPSLLRLYTFWLSALTILLAAVVLLYKATQSKAKTVTP